MASETALKQFGFTPKEYQRLNALSPGERQQQLLQNLEAYTNEVVEDRPVSILYHYWFDDGGKIYSHRSRKPIYQVDRQIDPAERDGLPLGGFLKTANLLRNNPNQVVLWYSPPGRAAFDKSQEGPYGQINYDYGQLYLQYFDGEKIDGLAIKITNEQIVQRLMGDPFRQAKGKQKEKEKIAHFLLNPIVTDFNIDDFLATGEEDPLVYQSKWGHLYSWHQILGQIRQTLLKIRKTPNLGDKTAADLLKFEATAQTIYQAYLAIIYSHMKQAGVNELVLSGSCGGNTVSSQTIEGLLGIKPFPTDNPFAQLVSGYGSTLRKVVQSEKGWDYHDGTCVVCHQKNKVGPCDICKNCEKKFEN